MKLFFSVLILLSASAWAGNFPKQVKWTCEREMTSTVKAFDVQLRGEWLKNYFETDAPSYKTATTKVGSWILAEKVNKQDSIVFLTPKTKTRYTYDSEKCTVKLEVTPLKKSDRKIASDLWFDDEALAELLQKKPNSILYIWSPYMTLSLKALPELQKAAQEVGLPITYLMDPQADDAAAAEVSKQHGLKKEDMKRVDSMELAMRNALIHYPTLMVIRDGKICKRVQRGYRKANKFHGIITNIFGNCQ